MFVTFVVLAEALFDDEDEMLAICVTARRGMSECDGAAETVLVVAKALQRNNVLAKAKAVRDRTGPNILIGVEN